jgi:hypothetical protein
MASQSSMGNAQRPSKLGGLSSPGGNLLLVGEDSRNQRRSVRTEEKSIFIMDEWKRNENRSGRYVGVANASCLLYVSKTENKIFCVLWSRTITLCTFVSAARISEP